MKPDHALREKINTLIQAALPEFTVHKSGIGFSLGQISIIASPPREYMGRYDEGKYRWTIDVKENATYSRMTQVRVKFTDNEPSFDATKLRAAVDEMFRRVEAHEAKERHAQERMKLLGDIPSWFNVKPSGDCYIVQYSAKMDLEKTLKFIEFIKTM